MQSFARIAGARQRRRDERGLEDALGSKSPASVAAMESCVPVRNAERSWALSLSVFRSDFFRAFCAGPYATSRQDFAGSSQGAEEPSEREAIGALSLETTGNRSVGQKLRKRFQHIPPDPRGSLRE